MYGRDIIGGLRDSGAVSGSVHRKRPIAEFSKRRIPPFLVLPKGIFSTASAPHDRYFCLPLTTSRNLDPSGFGRTEGLTANEETRRRRFGPSKAGGKRPSHFRYRLTEVKASRMFPEFRGRSSGLNRKKPAIPSPELSLLCVRPV